jgi:hypothetical protein
MNGITIPINLIGASGKPLVEEIQDCVNIYRQIEVARKAAAEEKKTYSYDIDQIESGVKMVVDGMEYPPMFNFDIGGKSIRFEIYEVTKETGERKAK